MLATTATACLVLAVVGVIIGRAEAEATDITKSEWYLMEKARIEQLRDEAAENRQKAPSYFAEAERIQKNELDTLKPPPPFGDTRGYATIRLNIINAINQWRSVGNSYITRAERLEAEANQKQDYLDRLVRLRKEAGR